MKKFAVNTIAFTVCIFLQSVFQIVDEIAAFCLYGFSRCEINSWIGNSRTSNSPIDDSGMGLASQLPSARSRAMKVGLLMLLALVLFYVLPTGIEWLLQRRFNSWFVSILLGDLLGCIFLATQMGLRRTASLVYLAATVVEAVLFVTGLISLHWLLWITDVLPTAVIAFCIAARMNSAVARPRAMYNG